MAGQDMSSVHRAGALSGKLRFRNAETRRHVAPREKPGTQVALHLDHCEHVSRANARKEPHHPQSVQREQQPIHHCTSETNFRLFVVTGSRELVDVR